jgi:hypothetical protein
VVCGSFCVDTTVKWPRSASVEFESHVSVRICDVCGICVLSESGRTIESTKNRETDFLGVAVLTPRIGVAHSSFAPPNNIITGSIACDER